MTDLHPSLQQRIDSLRSDYHVVPCLSPSHKATNNGHTTPWNTNDTRPILLLAAPALRDTEAALKLIDRGGILVVAPLADADDGSPRAVCSGPLTLQARSALVEHGVVYLGDHSLASARYKLVEEGMTAMHTAFMGEGVGLGLAMGVDAELYHRAISSAAGSSWAFRKLGPYMLGLEDTAPGQTFQQAVDALQSMLDVAEKDYIFSPLTALALQSFIAASEIGKPDPAGPSAAVAHHGRRAPKPAPSTAAALAKGLPAPGKPQKVAFIGLGAMGYGMAHVLRNAGYNVVGFDAYEPCMQRFSKSGGTVAASAAECAQDADVLVLMVVNVHQAEEVLVRHGAAKTLAPEAAVLLMSTVPPSGATALAATLTAARADAHLVDCPVSGGTVRADSGDLTLLCAGLDACGPTIPAALGVLNALSATQGNADNLVFAPGGPGAGAALKLLNQHAAGTLIPGVAEGLAFAKRLGLPLLETRDMLLTGPAQSFILWHRGGNMLRGLTQPPTSSITIFVKDLGIVTTEAKARGYAVPLAAYSRQAFVLGTAQGWGKDDDSSVVRIWNASGIDVKTEGNIV